MLAASVRERQRKERGEERKTHSELHPDLVAEVKRLRRASWKTGERTELPQDQQAARGGGVRQRAHGWCSFSLI